MYFLGESLIGVYLEYLLNNIKNILLACRNIPLILLIQIIKIHLHFYKPSLNVKIQSCANYNVQHSEEAKLCPPPDRARHNYCFWFRRRRLRRRLCDSLSSQ